LDAFTVTVPIRFQQALAIACVMLLAMPPLEGRTRKGDKVFKQGQKAEAQKDYDAALNFYGQALQTDAAEPAYLLADQRVRQKASEAHLTEGRKLQAQNKLDEALAQFQKAFLADPSSQVALQSIRETTNMIKEKAAGGPNAPPVLPPAERVRREMENRINSLEGPPQLKPINNMISLLKLNNQPARVLYESIGKLAGINVLFDSQGIEGPTSGKNYNLDLNNVTLDEALDDVALQTHTFWKPISRNAIFVTQESDQKRQEYQDEVARVFYIQNASTPNEFTEIFNAVRTGAKLTVGVFSVPTQNAIVARGSQDTIALVEKLIHDLDRPKAEVVVDVIVLSVNKSLSSTIGAALLGQGGLSVPLQFTPRTATTIPSNGTNNNTGNTNNNTGNTNNNTGNTINNGSTGISNTNNSGTTTNSGTSTSSSGQQLVTLARAGHLSSADYSVGLPGTMVQALMNDATTRILQRPQVRATDGGKASLKIGSKIPYVSGSLNSAVATAGSIPYATTQFQQVDVGTQIELQPHVNGVDDISMHLKVELSNVLQQTTIAGVQQPIIGQQVDEADIRMKEGEISVLGGLSDKESSQTLSGVPGFTNMPLLSYIFGSKIRSTDDREILIAMIPHIVRVPDLSAMGDTGVLAGTERVVRVQRRPDNTPAGAPGNPGQASNTAPVPVAPSAPLSPAPAVPGSGTTAPSPVPLSGTPNQQPSPGSNRTPAPTPNRPPGGPPAAQPPPQPQSHSGGPEAHP
jgi:general secretion pathway protein D